MSESTWVQNRVPAGVPAGGRWAEGMKGEAETPVIPSPSSPADSPVGQEPEGANRDSGEPELDPEYRAQQMMLLDTGLQEVAEEYSEHVFFYDDGEPGAFDPGNYVYLPAAGKDGSCFAIEERYAHEDDWEDEDRVPVGWSWIEYGPARMPDGSTQMRLQAQGTTVPSDIERLVDRARTWAREHAQRTAAADEPPAR